VTTQAIVDSVRRFGRPLHGDSHDLDDFASLLGRAHVVLLGEATHGTHDFYRLRADLTARLISAHGFSAVAVEADWPDAYRVNRYVRGASADGDATEAMGDFKRFPSWMWRNADVLDFVGWLRSFNEDRPASARAGFYGLDLYSLHASMRAVVAFLDKVDPAGAARARQRYACFDRFGDSVERYAHQTGLGVTASCERDVLTQLVDLRRKAADYVRLDGRLASDEIFLAEQNARVVRSAEEYYRTMFGGRVESWNLRDRHMADTLSDLIAFLGRTTAEPRIVVWAHNSHVGDARATEMGQQGEWNIGELARRRFGASAVLVGFTTHSGTVTAASEWDGPAHRRHVRPSLPGSFEHLFHETGLERLLLDLRAGSAVGAALAERRLERAIGVLYRPETERRSHYFHARLAQQFDHVIHLDETRAVEPLERTSVWDVGELAETFPSGL
jgi:erythromycin esterase-like protein